MDSRPREIWEFADGLCWRTLSASPTEPTLLVATACRPIVVTDRPPPFGIGYPSTFNVVLYSSSRLLIVFNVDSDRGPRQPVYSSISSRLPCQDPAYHFAAICSAALPRSLCPHSLWYYPGAEELATIGTSSRRVSLCATPVRQ